MTRKVSPYRLRALTLACTLCCFAGGSAIAAPYSVENAAPSGSSPGWGSDSAASSANGNGMISWQDNSGQTAGSETPAANPAPAWPEGYATRPAAQSPYGAYAQMQPPPQAEPVAYVPPPPGPYPVSPQELSEGASAAPQAEQHQVYGAASPMPYPGWGARSGSGMPNMPTGYGPQSPYPPMPGGNPYAPAPMPRPGMMPPGYAMQNGPAGYGAMPPAPYPMAPRWAGPGPYGPPPEAYGPPPRGPYPPVPEMNGPAPYPAGMPPMPGYGPMPEQYGPPPEGPYPPLPEMQGNPGGAWPGPVAATPPPMPYGPPPAYGPGPAYGPPPAYGPGPEQPMPYPPSPPMASGPYGPPPWATGPWGPR